MTVRAVVSLVTTCAVLIAASSPVLAADIHAVTPAQLHQTVHAFHDEAVAARKSVNAFLARAEVRAEIDRLGLSSERLAVGIARLNDADIAHLSRQVMALEQQVHPAGLTRAQIIWIVVGGAALVTLVVVFAVTGTDSTPIIY